MTHIRNTQIYEMYIYFNNYNFIAIFMAVLELYIFGEKILFFPNIYRCNNLLGHRKQVRYEVQEGLQHRTGNRV